MKEDQVRWITDPEDFILRNLTEIMKSYYSMISGQNYDPAKVGKTNGAYNLAYSVFRAAFKDELLRQHGISE